MVEVVDILSNITLPRLLIFISVAAAGIFITALLGSHWIDKIEGEWRHKGLVWLGWILLFGALVIVSLFLEVTSYAAFTP